MKNKENVLDSKYFFLFVVKNIKTHKTLLHSKNKISL